MAFAAPSDDDRRSAGPRVLLVEDNPADRRLIEIILASLGFALQTAPGGLEALRAAESGAFDLVLMDLSMPDFDGLETARRIRRLPRPAGDAPIIAVTDADRPRTAEAALSAGVTACVSRPIDVAALADLARRLSGEAADAAVASRGTARL